MEKHFLSSDKLELVRLVEECLSLNIVYSRTLDEIIYLSVGFWILVGFI